MNCRGWVIIALWAIALPSSGYGQNEAPKLPQVKQFGMDGFRLMLQQQGPEPTQTQIGSALDESPESTVLVMLGDMAFVPRFYPQIDRFVAQGGVLLLATDVRKKNRRLNLDILGARFDSTKPVPKEAAYRSLRDCPMVTRFNRSVEPVLFEKVNVIVANRPGRLRLGDEEIRRLAWLPSRSPATAPVLMATREHGQGRVLFVADHSIFVNAMLIHGDNAQFAHNVSRWLFRDGRRTKLVVINDNQVLGPWGLGETPPAVPLSSLLRAVQRGGWEDLPIGDSVLPVLNASLADFQRSDQLNYNLRRISQGLFGNRSLRVLLLGLAGLILAGLLRWLITSPTRSARWFSRQDERKSGESRGVRKTKRGQYQPYVRALARTLFADMGVRDWSTPEPPQSLLDASATDSRISKGVRHLWAVAKTDKPQRMSRRSYKKHMKLIRRVRDLQLSGNVRVE